MACGKVQQNAWYQICSTTTLTRHEFDVLHKFNTHACCEVRVELNVEVAVIPVESNPNHLYLIII